jgi:hypothetical protein
MRLALILEGSQRERERRHVYIYFFSHLEEGTIGPHGSIPSWKKKQQCLFVLIVFPLIY